MRTTNYLLWVCPACDCSTLIDPDEPAFYCSPRCENRASQAIGAQLAPSAGASRYLAKHLCYFFNYRHEIPESGERGRLAQAWAGQTIDSLNNVLDLVGRTTTVESLVFGWPESYKGGRA